MRTLHEKVSQNEELKKDQQRIGSAAHRYKRAKNAQEAREAAYQFRKASRKVAQRA